MKHKIAFAMMMGLVTTGIISFTLVSVNIGYIDRFLAIWFRSWGMAYMVVIPCILFIGPRVQQLVEVLFKEKIISNGNK